MILDLIDHYWLDSKLIWRIDKQWVLPKEAYLVSRQDDSVLLPKPKFALGFNLQALTGYDDSTPILDNLKGCLSPDGGPLCFPFMFIEVDDNAQNANLHAASQALYNIYLWMAQARLEDTFFANVRVFSLILRYQDLCVLVHRAEKCSKAKGSLRFCFSELLMLKSIHED